MCSQVLIGAFVFPLHPNLPAEPCKHCVMYTLGWLDVGLGFGIQSMVVVQIFIFVLPVQQQRVRAQQERSLGVSHRSRAPLRRR